MNAKTILQRLAVEEDARNNYTTFTACGPFDPKGFKALLYKLD